MTYNRVLNLSDYKTLGKRGKPLTSRKQWEVAMALKTLNDGGALKSSSEILGVGAGKEPTSYYLSKQVKRVWVTDLYVDPGAWSQSAPSQMLVNPAQFAPDDADYDVNRMVIQHMDMRDLRFPDGSFNGIFSSGSIEHVGTFADVTQAAAELGRVLRKDGILSLSTEFKISGAGDGWPGVLLLDEQALHKYIIEPSGCELIDEPNFTVDDDTRAQVWPLSTIVYKNKRPDVEVCLEHEGFTFTSVHLALKKK